MLKLHAALTTALATLFVAPAALSGDELDTLQAALREVDRALDVVVGVERRMEADPEGGVALVRQVTEAPILDAHRRDERLTALRNEVNLLRTELDQLELAALERGAVPLEDPVTPPTGGPGAGARPPAAPGNLGMVSTGLDAATRDALAKARADALARAEGRVGGDGTDVGSTTTGTTTTGGDGASVSPAAGGYSADPLRHARACYRAGRFAEGHALLADAEGAEALFWRARCAERMGDLEAAETDLREVLAMQPDGPFAARAQQDLEFVRWKRGFLERMEGSR